MAHISMTISCRRNIPKKKKLISYASFREICYGGYFRYFKSADKRNKRGGKNLLLQLTLLMSDDDLANSGVRNGFMVGLSPLLRHNKKKLEMNI